jgi:hypothetical protein
VSWFIQAFPLLPIPRTVQDVSQMLAIDWLTDAPVPLAVKQLADGAVVFPDIFNSSVP